MVVVFLLYSGISKLSPLSLVQLSHSVVSESAMDCSTPGFPVHHQLPDIAQIHAHQVRGVIQPSRSLSFPSLAFNLFQHQGFSNEPVLHITWPKYRSFSFSTIPFNEYLGLISFRMDWLVILAVQGTLKSLQHHRSKAPFLWCSALFMI